MTDRKPVRKPPRYRDPRLVQMPLGMLRAYLALLICPRIVRQDRSNATIASFMGISERKAREYVAGIVERELASKPDPRSGKVLVRPPSSGSVLTLREYRPGGPGTCTIVIREGESIELLDHRVVNGEEIEVDLLREKHGDVGNLKVLFAGITRPPIFGGTPEIMKKIGGRVVQAIDCVFKEVIEGGLQPALQYLLLSLSPSCSSSFLCAGPSLPPGLSSRRVIYEPARRVILFAKAAIKSDSAGEASALWPVAAASLTVAGRDKDSSAATMHRTIARLKCTPGTHVAGIKRLEVTPGEINAIKSAYLACRRQEGERERDCGLKGARELGPKTIHRLRQLAIMLRDRDVPRSLWRAYMEWVHRPERRSLIVGRSPLKFIPVQNLSTRDDLVEQFIYEECVRKIRPEVLKDAIATCAGITKMHESGMAAVAQMAQEPDLEWIAPEKIRQAIPKIREYLDQHGGFRLALPGRPATKDFESKPPAKGLEKLRSTLRRLRTSRD